MSVFAEAGLRMAGTSPEEAARNAADVDELADRLASHYGWTQAKAMHVIFEVLAGDFSALARQGYPTSTLVLSSGTLRNPDECNLIRLVCMFMETDGWDE